jgi:hypothetical protein
MGSTRVIYSNELPLLVLAISDRLFLPDASESFVTLTRYRVACRRATRSRASSSEKSQSLCNHEALTPDIANGFGNGELCENVDLASQSFLASMMGSKGVRLTWPSGVSPRSRSNCINVPRSRTNSRIPAQKTRDSPGLSSPKSFFPG